VPEISHKDWSAAFGWNSLKKTVQKLRHDNKTICMFRSGDAKEDLCKQQCKDYLAKDLQGFTSFNAFKSITSLTVVELNENDWKLSRCSCDDWLKYLKCAHIIAINQRLGNCTIPNSACIIPLSSNRKRGRPAGNQRALQKQPTDLADPEDEEHESSNEIITQVDGDQPTTSAVATSSNRRGRDKTSASQTLHSAPTRSMRSRAVSRK